MFNRKPSNLVIDMSTASDRTVKKVNKLLKQGYRVTRWSMDAEIYTFRKPTKH